MNSFVYDPDKKFMDPEKILFAAGLDKNQVVADFGCGSGFYSLAAGKLVGEQGTVYAIDVLEPVLEHLSSIARMSGIKNIRTIRADLELPGSLDQIATGTVDLVVMSTIAHQIANRQNLLTQAYRLLKTGGKVIIIEWNDAPSPIGPVAGQRIKEADIAELAQKMNLKPAGRLATDSYHYGLIFIK